MIRGYKMLGIKVINPRHYANIVITEKLTFWQRIKKKWFERYKYDI